jgi:prepilin-type N-terminal cleavage/methylation domain-containing protein
MQTVPRPDTRPKALRTGFTLVELLVVMAIIALLASLLFPAIQRVREGGRRTACLSQLHNLAIAAHDYNNVYRTLPSGWVSDLNNPRGDINTQLTQPLTVKLGTGQQLLLQAGTTFPVSGEWGWHAFILPQIEESNLVPDWNIPKDDGSNQWSPAFRMNGLLKIRTQIEVYLCPSSTLPQTGPDQLAFTNYRGNLGYWPLTQQTPLDNGVMFLNSQVELSRDIPDGTSHTLMIGESLFGLWGDAYACCARFRDDYATPNYFDQQWGTGPYFFGWGSYHGDIVNFVFADAHEASIPKNTDRRVLQAIATRNGGEPERLPN